MLKFYSAKSKATRALSQSFGEKAFAASPAILVQNEEDGKWGFDTDTAAQLESGELLFVDGVVIAKPAPVVAAPVKTVPAAKKSEKTTEEKPARKISAKQHIRNVFAMQATATLDDLLADGAYSEANIKTALSDLKNKYYSGGPLLVVTRESVNGVSVYSVSK